MKETMPVPAYTINQRVYVADFDDLDICFGTISKRVFNDENKEFSYIFMCGDGTKKIVEEADISLSFGGAKVRMENVIEDTLEGIKLLDRTDVRYL